MTEYAWPGNVRELENAVLHAIALHHGESIGPESLPPQIAAARARNGGARRRSPTTTTSELGRSPRRSAARARAFEKRYLTRVMERAKGSVSEAARLAGLDRTNFRRLLQRHGIDRDDVQVARRRRRSRPSATSRTAARHRGLVDRQPQPSASDAGDVDVARHDDRLVDVVDQLDAIAVRRRRALL